MRKRQVFHSKLYVIGYNVCSNDISHSNAFRKSDWSNQSSYGSGKNSVFLNLENSILSDKDAATRDSHNRIAPIFTQNLIVTLRELSGFAAL